MNNNNKSKVNSQEEEGVFKTADFVLSAFLLYSEVELIRVESYPDDRNKNKKNFVFKKTDQLNALMNHFISSDPTVRIKKICNVQKNLKRMIYDNQQPTKKYV